MTRRIVQICNVVMEVSWLLALVSIPIYFNIYTARVFEPDKIAVFRSLVLVMAGAWLTKFAAQKAADLSSAGTRQTVAARKPARRQGEEFPPDGEAIGPETQPLGRVLLTRPLVFPALAISFAYIVATIFSVQPDISFWGSYDRGQGTYTFLCYVTFFLTLVFNIRERRQIERLISFVLLTSLPVSLYGILQHNKADPLPWQGDTTFRVTSTMGNAIFISAYMIMGVPLILYRIITTGSWLMANRSSAAKSFSGRLRDTALSWTVLYGGMTIFELGMFYVTLNMNANYRPESTSVAQAAQSAIGSSGSAAGSAQQYTGGTTIGPFWSLPLAIVLSFGLFLLFTLRRKDTDNNYLFRIIEISCYVLLLALNLLVIVYSQSRGPLAGLLVCLYIVPPILFAVRKHWKWLIGWLGIGVLGGVFLLLFNLPVGSTPLEPAFSILRKNPEIARLGQFLETEDGTGKVRRLIWQTDFEILGNSASKDPLRLVFGNGPESMYFISPLFYQVDLAYVEARNAIPDRSHNGYLDSLVITGIFGFLVYLFLIGSFFFYCVKFIRRTKRFDTQVLLACLVAVLLSHLIEITTGIPIVSSWMMFWMAAAMVTVIGGLTLGSYGAKPVNAELAATPLPVEEEKEEVLAGKKGGKAKMEAAATIKEEKAKPAKAGNKTRTATETRNPASRGVTNPVRPQLKAAGGGFYFNTLTLDVPEVGVKGWFWAVPVLLGAFIVYVIWTINLMPIFADTSYKMGLNLVSAGRQEDGVYYYQQAARQQPNQDRYRLYLGQIYLDLAQKTAQKAQQTSTTDQAKSPTATPTAQDLNAQVIKYYQSSESELLKAVELAPLNPDHYANLGRLYGQWVQVESAKRKELFQKQNDWYAKAIVRAPRNSRVRTEYAAALVNSSRNLDGTVDQNLLQQAIQVGEDSVKLDPRYDFGRWVLGDIYLSAGRTDDAAVQYAKLVEINTKELANNPRYLQRLQLLATSTKVDQNAVLADMNKNFDQKSLTNADRAYYEQTIGIFQFNRNNMVDAEQALGLAIQLDQNLPYARAYNAVLYQRTGRASLANDEAQKALNLASSQAADVKSLIQTFLTSSGLPAAK